MTNNRTRLYCVLALVAVFSLATSGYALAAGAEQAAKGAAGASKGAATESAKSTTKETATKPVKGTATSKKKVNINTASAAELAKLPGVGKKGAADIVAHREKHGHFKNTMELKQVKGLGGKKYESLKDKITTE